MYCTVPGTSSKEIGNGHYLFAIATNRKAKKIIMSNRTLNEKVAKGANEKRKPTQLLHRTTTHRSEYYPRIG